ncbi:hypothetical protein V5O48_019061 [Marasmius crinis-equi]|uniref:Uncharacterized protein n=1 Tax=Marasmius crinis-equi TaxID=585013 RepID=A0ABR3EJF6_9AGAR
MFDEPPLPARKSKARKGKGRAQEDDDEVEYEDELDFDKMDGAGEEEGEQDGEVDGEEDSEVEEEEDGEDTSAKPKKRFRLEYNQYELDRMAHIENVKKQLAAVGVEQAVNDLFQRNASNADPDGPTEPEPEPEPEQPITQPKASQPLRPQPRRVTRSSASTPNASDSAAAQASSAVSKSPSSPPSPEAAPASSPPAPEGMVVDSTQPAENDTTPSRELFLRSYSDFEVTFDPVVDKVEPRGYSECDLARNMGEFLLAIPKDRVDVYKTRSTLYDAVVYKWMEVEAVLKESGVKDVKTSTSNRPKPFTTWFKNGRLGDRLGKAGSLDTPATAQLQEFRDSWWIWFDKNMPEWMLRIDGKVVPGGEGDWEDCEMPGKDGMVLFVVGLKWWYDLAGKEDEQGDWEQAAKAVYNCLDRTLTARRQNATPPLPAVRPSPDSSPAANNRTKRRRTE